MSNETESPFKPIKWAKDALDFNTMVKHCVDLCSLVNHEDKHKASLIVDYQSSLVEINIEYLPPGETSKDIAVFTLLPNSKYEDLLSNIEKRFLDSERFHWSALSYNGELVYYVYKPHISKVSSEWTSEGKCKAATFVNRSHHWMETRKILLID